MSRSRALLLTATTVATAAALSLAAPTGAGASSGTANTGRTVAASDPDDVGNRLDIVSERFTLDDGTITLAIRTAESWRCGYPQDFGENGEPYSAGLIWEFDRGADGTFGDGRDINGTFDCLDGRLVFELRDGGNRVTKTYRASRPTGHSAVVSLPRAALDTRHLNVRAISRFNGTKGDHTAFEEDDITKTLRAY